MLILILDWFLHFDHHLATFLAEYGTLTYVIVFLIILCETGLVVTPFLPGDSLLFAVGALAGQGLMNIWVLLVILLIAAIAGDFLNFSIGRYIGKAVYSWNSRWIRKEHLEKTHQFYEKHGGVTIIIARFMPIVRTFAPFVAGVANMNYAEFFFYNIVGGLLWVVLFLGGGYFFGSIPLVKDNFSIVILVIIFISVLPGVFFWLKEKWKKPAQPIV